MRHPSPIEYKEFYNKEQGLPEPKWGPVMTELQCPWCGSHDVYGSGHPDDPEEIFPYETVRCKTCGHITDWYEAREQWNNHFTVTVRKIVREKGVKNESVCRC